MDHPFLPNGSGTLSSRSTTGSEWSGINGYQTMSRSASPNSPKPLQGIPPDPGHMRGVDLTVDGLSKGLSSGARRPSAPATQTSSPSPSVLNPRSSDGTLSDQQSMKYRRMEAQLLQHYDVLKRYLQGGQPQPPRPNKAKDKLLRLSATQFHELSTDVYDEFIRRQAATPVRPPPGRPPQRPPKVPPYLLARSDFHEKRNQARQKLSSLLPPRFRDLATDVFCELDSRFPHFKDIGSSPRGSPSASMQGGLAPRGTTPNGLRPGLPPRGPSSRGPAPALGGIGTTSPSYPRRHDSIDSPPPGAENTNQNGVRGSESDYREPIPKQFQSHTIIPNKSTMVEEEEEVEEEDDEFAMYDKQYEVDRGGRTDASATSRSFSSSALNLKLVEARSKAEELQSKIEKLEINLNDKDEEIRRLQDVEHSHSTGSDWVDVKQDLEKRLEDAETLNQSLRDELDLIQTDQANVERDLRSQLDRAIRSQDDASGWKTKHDQLERDYQHLQSRLREQQRVTEEVRQQASGFLEEMRAMAESGGSSWEREEKLKIDIRRLEDEVKEWKGRYAKSKAQLRNLRASSMGLSMSRPDVARYAKANEFTQADGMVKDIHVTKFQISIDELLRIARTEDPSAVLNHVKSVVMAVRSISQDIDAAGMATKDDERVQRQGKLKSKVSATANNVITASKNYASSNGISPVSLLDAAASHLTMAVVDLIRAVKIRPTPPGELDEEDETESNVESIQDPAYFNVESGHTRSESASESVYSAVSTPPASSGSSGAATTAHASNTSSDSANITGYEGIGRPESASAEAGSSMRAQDNGKLEDLKLYLEDQYESLVQFIQSLIGSVRAKAHLDHIRNHITSIARVVDLVISATKDTMATSTSLLESVEPVVSNLTRCKLKLISANAESEDLRTELMSRVPPMAFEIARETKELVERVGMVDKEQTLGQEDYS